MQLGWSFWLPFIIQVVLGGAGSAVVGFLAVRVVRGIGHDLFGEQQRTTNAAEAAASRAGESLDATHKAVKQAASTGEDARLAADNSRQANAVLEWLATQLAMRDAAMEDMQGRIDGLLGTRARQLAAERVEDQPAPAAAAIEPDADDDDDDDDATITGRHRLHTQYISTIDEGDPA